MKDPVAVSVALPPAFERFLAPESGPQRDLVAELGRLLDDLVDDLRIPVEVSVEVANGVATRGITRPHARMTIGGARCRAPVGAVVEPEAGPVELARGLARIAHRNRALFVSPVLAERLQAQWQVERPAVQGFPPGLFHAVLAQLAGSGFRIDRARDLPPWDAATARRATAQDYFEQVVRHSSSIRLGLWLGSSKSMTDPTPLEETLRLMQDGLFYELGLRVPRVAPDPERTLASNEFRLRVNDVRCPPMRGLEPDQFLANERPDRLRLLGLEGTPWLNPASGNQGTVLRETGGVQQRCIDAGFTTWGPLGYATLATSVEIRRNAGDLTTMETVDFDLRFLQRAFPELVTAATRRFDLLRLTRIIRELLEEEISTRNLRGILESLLAVEGTTNVDLSRLIAFLPNTEHLCPVPVGKSVGDLSVADYLNCVRMSMKRYISHKYSRGANTLMVYLMRAEAEARLAQAGWRPLTAEEHDRLIDAVWAEVRSLPDSRSSLPVILTSIDARRPLRRALEIEFPYLAVLCYQELSPDLNIQPVARIEFEP